MGKREGNHAPKVQNSYKKSRSLKGFEIGESETSNSSSILLVVQKKTASSEAVLGKSTKSNLELNNFSHPEVAMNEVNATWQSTQVAWLNILIAVHNGSS